MVVVVVEGSAQTLPTPEVLLTPPLSVELVAVDAEQITRSRREEP
jgi:hypothetical protein